MPLFLGVTSPSGGRELTARGIREDRRGTKAKPFTLGELPTPRLRGGDVAATRRTHVCEHAWVGVVSQCGKEREEVAGRAILCGARGFTPISAP
jgi:hypothetical protein